MLKLRATKSVGPASMQHVEHDRTLNELCEDTDYVITIDEASGTRLYVDDIELRPSASGEYQWRPSFYAGRVMAEVFHRTGLRQHCWLDVSPTSQKSAESQFEEMVAEIRAFDTKLLGGTSAAAMTFGHEGQAGLFSNDIQLSRVRTHGPGFLDAVEAISRTPHLSISSDSQVLPLSRIRKLHPTAFRDRRLAALATGSQAHADAFQTIQLRSVTSSPTYDTPANQTLLALLKRFRATVQALTEKVATRKLGVPTEEQDPRVERRLRALDELYARAGKLVLGSPFSETSKSQTSSSGLTQIASQPIYSKAYRLGSRSLALGVDGIDRSDELHVNYSWGIYETWCFLAVVDSIKELVGCIPVASKPRAVSAVLAFTAKTESSASLEILFQANFPSLGASQERSGFSISRARIPDILIVKKTADSVRSMVLDAKWRSGRENVLEAMQSAHIYHDSLRVAGLPPSPCILLLPGNETVPELEHPSYIAEHCVGAISDFNIGAHGIDQLKAIIGSWLTH